MTPTCGAFADLRRFDAKSAIVSELHRLNLFKRQVDHKTVIPVCSRSRDVVEYLAKPQWFVRCDEMAARCLEAVRGGQLVIEPPHFVKNWESYLENIR